MFETKGIKPQWEMVYDLFHGADVGDVVTYDALSEALGFDFLANRQPVYKATEALQREDRRTIVNVKGRGYRIASASEHAPLAEDRRRRARRQIRRGKNTVACARVEDMSAEDAKHNDAVLLRLSALESFTVAQERKNARTDAAMATVATRIDRTDRKAGGTDQRVDHLIEQLRNKGLI